MPPKNCIYAMSLICDLDDNQLECTQMYSFECAFIVFKMLTSKLKDFSSLYNLSPELLTGEVGNIK